MKLEEAIEIKTQYLKDHYTEMSTLQWDADTMSIEALKTIKDFREGDTDGVRESLEGETED